MNDGVFCISLNNETKRPGIKVHLNRSNIAFKSLRTAIKFSIENRGNNDDFEPVCWGIINGVMIGHIGMVRYVDGYLDFSYYDAARNDCDAFKLFINLGKSWELAAIESVNSFINSKGYCEERNLIKVKVYGEELKPAILKLCSILSRGFK